MTLKWSRLSRVTGGPEHAAPPPKWRGYELPSLDNLVEEFRAIGLFSPSDSRVYPKELGLPEQVRKAASTAILMSVLSANSVLVSKPRYMGQAKRYFEDLDLILHLIDRNKHLDISGTSFSLRLVPDPAAIWYVDPPDVQDFTRNIQSSLQQIMEEIECYVGCFQPIRPESLRNLDPLSHFFIENMLYVWFTFRGFPTEWWDRPLSRLPRPDRRAFVRLLAAAWRDAGLPLTTSRGSSREPLEAWFSDRIRKQSRNLPDDDFEANSVDT